MAVAFLDYFDVCCSDKIINSYVKGCYLCIFNL